MNAKMLASNAAVIEREISWFCEIVDQRFQSHSGKAMERDLLRHIEPPELPNGATPYADVVRKFDMGPAERLVLILAYAPHIRPEILKPY